ncbi:sigma factor [Streptomyces olindensis]|uniref:Sigma factor n=1 Tax=Streptomyces olindensis TaxID=358823 RepID=A0ABV2Y3T3_9ACTN
MTVIFHPCDTTAPPSPLTAAIAPTAHHAYCPCSLRYIKKTPLWASWFRHGVAPGAQCDALRERAITAFLPVARWPARRYGSPADGREDFYQVAGLGLVKAVDRFDPARGCAFLSWESTGRSARPRTNCAAPDTPTAGPPMTLTS